MKPPADEIVREVERILRSNLLSPQERALFRRIIRRTLEGDTSQLYQKALADELGIANAKQIGVVATRIRSKLADHYRRLPSEPGVQIEVSSRGYEALFS